MRVILRACVCVSDLNLFLDGQSILKSCFSQLKSEENGVCDRIIEVVCVFVCLCVCVCVCVCVSVRACVRPCV